MINVLLFSIFIFAGSGFAALLCNRHRNPQLPAWIGRTGALAGAFSGMLSVVMRFLPDTVPASSDLYGIYLNFDNLSAFFLLPVLLVGGAAAIHSPAYLKGHDHGKSGNYWFFFNMTLASMTLVTLVRTPLTFLLAWELMGTMSFALVAFEYRSKLTRQAAWIYLLACEAGALFLIGFFVFAGREISPAILFALLLIGFGLKAGLPFLHIWLPEAHPAAPAPVSAVMSAAMIKLGLYGVLRFHHMINIPDNIIGWTLLFCGLAGALFGIIAATAQSNLKRLLAYSSIENIGIICIGLGLGFLGINAGNSMMAAAGFCGALLHLLNHMLLKGSLFMLAGTVYKATGTLNMDRMGGLMKRMPRTGWLFAFSGISISGIPPFNGFLGEFLIYAAAYYGIISGTGTPVFFSSLLTMITLALVGGIAAGAFSKAIGGIFLGEPRTREAADASQAPLSMDLPPFIFTLLSLAMIFLAGNVCAYLIPVITDALGVRPCHLGVPVAELQELLCKLSIFALIVTGFFVLLQFLRSLLMRNREVTVRGTWDCGYAAPDARMEYTATAFSQPLSDFLHRLTGWRKEVHPPRDFFPKEAGIRITTADPAAKRFWVPVFHAFGTAAVKVRILQSGLLHLYILIMVTALILMLFWGYFFCGGQSESIPKTPAATKTVEVKK